MRQVMISAHRCGAGDDAGAENTAAALVGACALKVEYVEFDVQRSSDGSFVVSHDPLNPDQLSTNQLPTELMTYDEVLDALAASGKAAHVDLKFVSADEAYDEPSRTAEVEATALAIARLGVERVIVTSNYDRSIKAIREWADGQGHDLLVGLSLGTSVRGFSWWQAIKVRWSELFPHWRYHRSGANLAVAHHTLARVAIARFARNRNLPLLVWTVDGEKQLAYWLSPGRAWMVTTNHPTRALAIRAGQVAAGG